ncbi:MAG: hypothetical protein H8E28_02330 [Anaerolineae bacterium]|nr:hypothetical protein [Anaerolineae bacterium]MBL6965156.1 hypothetical protein [Anaerolineales bacterium]
MLNHDFYYPHPLPQKVYSPGLSNRSDRWQRQILALWIITQGYSLGVEILQLTAEPFGTNPRSGALRQVIPDLRNAELVKIEVPKLKVAFRRLVPFIVVQLTDKGRDLAEQFGWTVSESEWERMQRLHEKGNYQGQHTLAALVFAYQARLRGWSVGIIPELDAGRFYPDALVEKGGESYYVEVELGDGKLTKWANMAKHGGYIALCARAPEHREQLLAEAASSASKHSRLQLGTDLQTLLANPDSPLWLERIE